MREGSVMKLCQASQGKGEDGREKQTGEEGS